MGSIDLEAGRIDCFSEHTRDIREKYQKAKSTAGEEQRKAALAAFSSQPTSPRRRGDKGQGVSPDPFRHAMQSPSL